MYYILFLALNMINFKFSKNCLLDSLSISYTWLNLGAKAKIYSVHTLKTMRLLYLRDKPEIHHCISVPEIRIRNWSAFF